MLTSNPNSRITRPRLSDPRVIGGNLPRRIDIQQFDIRSDYSPTQIIELLASGNQQYVKMRAQSVAYNSLSLSGVAQGMTPVVAVLNYARLPTAIENIFGRKFSDIFAIDSTQQFPTFQEISTLEYAVMFSGVKVIVILDEASEEPQASASARGKQIEIATKHAKLLICERLQIEPAIYQRARLDRLEESPLLSRFIERGKLKIVGAAYDPQSEIVNLIDRSEQMW
jgi:carbonic anhydrase